MKELADVESMMKDTRLRKDELVSRAEQAQLRAASLALDYAVRFFPAVYTCLTNDVITGSGRRHAKDA